MSGRYLITGVAGSGKTTLEKIFRTKGYITADIDNGLAEWRHATTDEILPYTPGDKDWHQVAEWTVRKTKLQELLDTNADKPILVFGSFARQNQVAPMFDKIFLLKYPNLETVSQRVTRRSDGYGKHPHELDRILGYVESYQTTMLQAGAQEIDCTLPLDEVVKAIADNID